MTCSSTEKKASYIHNQRCTLKTFHWFNSLWVTVKFFNESRRSTTAKFTSFKPSKGYWIEMVKIASQCWAWSLKTRMPIPSGHQLLIIGRFAEYLLASGAYVVETCPPMHELNIKIVIAKSVWDLPLHGKSLNYIIDLNGQPTIIQCKH